MKAKIVKNTKGVQRLLLYDFAIGDVLALNRVSALSLVRIGEENGMITDLSFAIINNEADDD